MKEGHKTLFIGPTGCEKSAQVVKLLEKEYKFHFDFIVIICPTLKWNQTYKSAKWFWNDPHVFLIEPNNDNLFDWIKKLSYSFVGYKTLFLLDGIIADNSLNQKKESF